MQKNNIKIGRKENRNKFYATFLAMVLVLTTVATTSLVASSVDEGTESIVTTNSNSDLESSAPTIPSAPLSTATIWTTDEYGNPKFDFAPGDLVYIQGTGFNTDTDVELNITRPDGWLEEAPDSVPVDRFPSDVLPHTDSNGDFSDYIYDLDGVLGEYLIQTTDGVNYATITFTDAPPQADLDQARNGAYDDPVSPINWVNGNLGSEQAHYVEGYSVPYRCVMDNLPIDGTEIILTLGYDIKHSDRHALDFLTYYNRTNIPPHFDVYGHPCEEINPLQDITGVSSTETTWPVPAPSSDGSPVPGQPTTAYNNITAEEGTDGINMTLFGGTISDISYHIQGSLTDSQSETQINITFTVDSETAVLAWGGHIASRIDWGYDGNGDPRSAGGISGSPYHMRTIDWNLNNLGNQDRSLSAVAVWVPPGNIIVEKVAIGGDETFDYTGDLGDFSLATSSGYASTTFSSIQPGIYDITELAEVGWTFNSIVIDDPSGGSSSSDTTATVDLLAGETVTVTYTNEIEYGTIIVEKQTLPDGSDQSFTFSGDAAGSIKDGEQIVVSG
jgi:hypothetical protein